MDDDSPYFVKITLDKEFLKHLEEPDVFESEDIPAHYQTILDNKPFK